MQDTAGQLPTYPSKETTLIIHGKKEAAEQQTST